ncbi:hypothetical protein [Flavobacterium beibuense]|uniref:Uncharacterized protein n=1 Tax=Flavobacterium beibuense TaxID=657326 RepID=A0A444WEW8_9FLAO|nr:hypothetical protein [Flavobacterium beibuense]RYJ44367.1 hypothetical protein NU09_0977 [Flavobacterium beibuense]
MQNLLNEEEFIQPKAYNPWRWFFLCYGIEISIVFLFNMILFFFGQPDMTLNISTIALYICIGSIFLLPFVITFGKKKNIYKTQYKTILLAVMLGVYCSYFFSILWRLTMGFINGMNKDSLTSIIDEKIFMGVLFMTLYGIVSFLLCLPILIYLRKKKQKQIITA